MLLETWSSLGPTDRLVYNKLITGGFRVGVSAGLVVRGLARATGLPADALTHRLMGHWEPTAEFYGRLVDPDLDDAATSRPYPFCLAHPLADPADLEGPADAWQVEWKWDGIRAQVVRRGGRVFIWTRGGELATDAFPEVAEAARALPDGTVLDGELLAWRDGVLPFDQMQRRIGRKKVGRKLLSDVPVVLKAFDLVEDGGEDLRDAPLSVRRERLERRVRSAGMGPVGLSECLEAATWDDVAAARDASRDRGVEGVMLKRLDGVYATGRPRGLWWKWKVTPHTVDAVLVYAQPGHGRRAGLYTDYTFAVWDQDSLVPFAKAYSGLSDAEIREVDRFVRQHTIERFGPVRSVRPEIVIEIAFEGIWRSRRHKSGVAVRFPRMHRRRTDLRAEDADTLDTLRALLRDGEDGPDE